MISDDVYNYIKTKLFIVSNENILVEPVGNGRSGAEVYRIRARSQNIRLTGCYIIKICDINEDKELTEAYKAQQLYKYADQFSEHLVKVEAEDIINGKVVIIYAQANNSVMNSSPFLELDVECLEKYTRCVSKDLLKNMNNISKIEQVEVDPNDFFNKLVGRQLSSSGRFVDRIEALLERSEAECLILNGVIYPNPLYFIRNIGRLAENFIKFNFMKGAVHGDLHGYNLLAADNTYAIIDYDSASIDSYLFFDHAYFEFSIFYDKSQNNDLKQWMSMLDHLIAPSLFKNVEPYEKYMEYKVRNAICAGINDWICEYQLQKQKDFVEIQFIMARIAAGINFFCKKTCNDIGRQVKVLSYVAYCIKLLSKKIGYQYNENNASSLKDFYGGSSVEKLWEDFVKYTNYIPVLITDDRYISEDVETLRYLCGINWSLVIDIGLEQKESIIYKVFLNNYKNKEVKKINVIEDEKVETFNHIMNILSIRKSDEGTYAGLWRSNGKRLRAVLNKLVSENPLVPLLLVFDCARDSVMFRNQIVNMMCDTELPAATRFVTLRTEFSEDLKQEIPELETIHKWHFVKYAGIDLLSVAKTCETYLNASDNRQRYANVPSVNGVYTFSENDLNNFESSIELVYTGCEYNAGININISEIRDDGESFGERFYRGCEATWNDIKNHRDLPLMERGKYSNIKNNILEWMEEGSPRVRTIELCHGAGTGGTTLSKRILWDLKDSVPCVCLKKYLPLTTASILLEIYQKTGKRVLLTIESGSTIITEEELNQLEKDIDKENGKLMILLIKRTGLKNSKTQEDSDKQEKLKDNKKPEKQRYVLYTLLDTMTVLIAREFNRKFCEYADKKHNATERKLFLNNITGKDQYKEQRSPFFYGFYAFQEEYELFDSLGRTIAECTQEERKLLNCLAVITIFSQNIFVAFREVPMILKQQTNDKSFNVYVIKEMISSAIYKLMSIREGGYRLCHGLIAKKILLLLHDAENRYKADEWENVVFKAMNEYINVMSEMYDNESEYLNETLRELVIDRAYIDSEDRKTKFSILVESIPHWSDRKKLFDNLIEKFPNNPHYHNHLARLLAMGDKNNNLPKYEEAIEEAQKAVDVAENAKNTHETTLGCIYGWWVLNKIREETRSKQNGTLSLTYSEIIENIRENYFLAKSAFENAREYSGESGYDSFSFFPQIKMECSIINELIKYDSERSLKQLLKAARKKENIDEAEFAVWYEEHFSIATELYMKWWRYRKEDRKFLNDAKYLIREIGEDFDEKINEQFNEFLNSDLPVDRKRSRSLIYRYYAFNGLNWQSDMIKAESLYAAEKCARKNLIELDEEHREHDFEMWFELYRRVGYFDVSEAQSLIADYAPEGYRKEYLQFLMTFIMRKNGVSSASSEAIIKRIKESNRKASSQGINTLRELDVYVGINHGIIGCPIVSVSEVTRGEDRNPEDLEVFKGTVIEVGQTHGKILLDKLNLDVTFIPNPTSISKNDSSRRFTREDIGKVVKLNIMFAYSGIRGWNVVKIN